MTILIELLVTLLRLAQRGATALLDRIVDLLPMPEMDGPWSDFGVDLGHVGTDDMWATWLDELDLCRLARA